MNKILCAIVWVVIIAGSVALFVRQRTNDLLRAEIAGLRARSADLPHLQENYQRLLKQADARTKSVRQQQEIAALRGKIAALRRSQSAKAHPGLAAENPAARLGLRRAEAWEDRGRATPQAALETSLWAAARGDVGALARLIHLEADGRAQAEALLSTLPEGTRADYASAEQFVAVLLAAESPLGSMEVTKESAREPDQVRLDVLLADTDSPPAPSTFLFRREPSGWALVVNGKMVAQIGRLIQ